MAWRLSRWHRRTDGRRGSGPTFIQGDDVFHLLGTQRGPGIPLHAIYCM